MNGYGPAHRRIRRAFRLGLNQAIDNAAASVHQIVIDGKTVAEVVRRENARIVALEAQANAERARWEADRNVMRARGEVALAKLRLHFARERLALARLRRAIHRYRGRSRS